MIKTIESYFIFAYFLFFGDRVSLFHLVWSAAVRIQLLKTPPSGIKGFFCLSLRRSQDYRCLSTCLAKFCIFLGFTMLNQSGLELLTSDDLPVSASQSARITSMSHCTWLVPIIFISIFQSSSGVVVAIICKLHFPHYQY